MGDGEGGGCFERKVKDKLVVFSCFQSFFLRPHWIHIHMISGEILLKSWSVLLVFAEQLQRLLVVSCQRNMKATGPVAGPS